MLPAILAFSLLAPPAFNSADDPRASYVILHPDRAEFIRVAYDIASTASKIKAVPQLPGWLADRLFDGR